MPSSTHPEASLTVWDASSSRLTLFIVVVFLPVVLVYTGFVLRVMRGRVGSQMSSAVKPSTEQGVRFDVVLQLGTGPRASSFAILNAMWLEITDGDGDAER
jgi:cyd operon protein YbgT